MFKNRYITDAAIQDLSEKMVFIGGPRQVGKTTLAKDIIAGGFNSSQYYNWDNREDRKRILQLGWPGQADLLVFDEIHKYRQWKSFIKGEYDKLKEQYRFLVTGSARLDVYRRGGDSMLGRYHYYRLHPFSLAETCGRNNLPTPFDPVHIPSVNESDTLMALDKFGGFPEPFIKQNSRTLRRWHNERVDRLIREDIRDVATIKDISGMMLLGEMLPERAGSALSINSFREDIGVSHKALTNWFNIFESMYYCFRVYPHAAKNFRSLKKEPKLFLWDWSEIRDEAARFENLMGSHLLKLVHYLRDYEGFKTQLKYLRTIEKKEVDFLVTCDNRPWFAVEVKLNQTKVSPNLAYFRSKLDIPFSFQVVKKTGVDILVEKDIRVVSADRFLAGLI